MEQIMRRPVLLLLVLFFYQCQGQNTTRSSLGFDCRRGHSEAPSCMNSGSCVLDTGKCTCDTSTAVSNNYQCQNNTPTPDCTLKCEKGVCHNSMCVCDEDFYGPKCDTPRLLILCRNDKMLVSINPSQNQSFTDLIKQKGNGNCSFTTYSNSSVDHDFDEEIKQRFPDLSGWYQIFKTDNSSCSASSDNSSISEPSFYVNIYIQYNRMYTSAVDQLVEARCFLSSNVTQVNANVSDIDSSSGDIDHVKGDGKVDVVSLKVTRKDGTAINGKVRLGEEIHLNFTLPKGSSTNFKLTKCSANNTKETSSGFQSVVFIEDGCPLRNASSLFAGLTIKENSTDKLSRTVPLKVFKFIDSSSIGFSCQVTICGASNAENCKDPDCPEFAATTIANTGTNGNNPSNGTDNSSGNSTSGGTNNPVSPTNSTSGGTNLTASPSSVRRRRDAKNPDSANVGATLNVEGADDEDSSSAMESPSTSACMQKPDITAVVIVLAVCVFLLLLLSALLLYRLLNSNLKTGSNSRPEGSTRPVETLRFPRLEMASTYNNSL